MFWPRSGLAPRIYEGARRLRFLDGSHIFGPAEYHGMSGEHRIKISEVSIMCGFSNNGFGGGNLCWIIILLILFCGCGNNSGCGCEQDRGGCGCC